jgi:hypothetical protein
MSFRPGSRGINRNNSSSLMTIAGGDFEKSYRPIMIDLGTIAVDISCCQDKVFGLINHVFRKNRASVAAA